MQSGGLSRLTLRFHTRLLGFPLTLPLCQSRSFGRHTGCLLRSLLRLLFLAFQFSQSPFLGLGRSSFLAQSGFKLRLVKLTMQLFLHNPTQIVADGNLDPPEPREKLFQHISVRFAAAQVHQFFLPSLEHSGLIDQKKHFVPVIHARSLDGPS